MNVSLHWLLRDPTVTVTCPCNPRTHATLKHIRSSSSSSSSTITWPGAEVACGLSLSLTDCTFLLENRDSCVFELFDCFLALWLPVRAVLWVDAESGWLHLALFSCSPWGNLCSACQAHTVDGYRTNCKLFASFVSWRTHGRTDRRTDQNIKRPITLRKGVASGVCHSQ